VPPLLISTDAICLLPARDLSSMTGYNVRLREPPRIRICLVQANLGNIILKAVCPAAKPLPQEKRCEITEKQLKRDRISPNPLEYFLKCCSF